MDPLPPEYEVSQKVVKKPEKDVASLPENVTKHVTVTVASSEGPITRQPKPQSEQDNSYKSTIWKHYTDVHRCHPKNVCYGCCFRPTEENEGKRDRKWYNPVGSGPLRVVGLLIYWLLCGPCFGCYLLAGRVRSSMYRGAKWYNPVDAGPFGLLFFWLFCGPCFCCYYTMATLCDLCSCLETCWKSDNWCCQFCFYLCWYDPDDIDYD